MVVIKKDITYDTTHNLKTDIYFPNNTTTATKILIFLAWWWLVSG